MRRPVHFEIHADDPERAVEFYTLVFGWDFQRWGELEYWVATTGDRAAPGIDGAVLPRRGPGPEVGAPVNAYVCTIDVPDLEATVEAATERGAEMRLPRFAVPGVGWQAYLADTEGNLFGVLQADSAAR
jgi:predicted enzyme related to lactoylglutathione lyase